MRSVLSLGLAAALIGALVCQVAAAQPDLPRVEDDWATEEILQSGQPSGWLVSAPTREMARHLASRAAPHAVDGKMLRKAFPDVAPPRSCGFSWDIRIFPKDFAFFGSLKSVLQHFMVDPARPAGGPKQVVHMSKQAERPAMQTTNIHPGDAKHPHKAHAYLAVDTGENMLILDSITRTKSAEDLEKCSGAYAEKFQLVARRLAPVQR